MTCILHMKRSKLIWSSVCFLSHRECVGLGKAFFGSRQPARSFRGGRKFRFFLDGLFLINFGRLPLRRCVSLRLHLFWRPPARSFRWPWVHGYQTKGSLLISESPHAWQGVRVNPRISHARCCPSKVGGGNWALRVAQMFGHGYGKSIGCVIPELRGLGWSST